MNTNIFLYLYTLFWNIFYITCVQYEKESHFHNQWWVVNVTCLETGDKASLALLHNQFKRSIDSYDAFRNDVSLDTVQFMNEPLNISTGYDHNAQVSHLDISKGNASDLELSDSIGRNNPDNITLNDKNASLVPINDSSLSSGVDVPLKVKFNASKTSVVVNCDFLELSPNIIDPAVKHLKLKSSGHLKLTSEWAHYLSDLSDLKINVENGIIFPSNNSCSWIPSSVTTIDFAHTSLTSFNLSHCGSSLQKLYLQGTSLKDLTLCVSSLKDLDASWNSLQGKGVNVDCDSGNPNVEVLKLHNNEINVWTSCGWPSLTHLELQKNEISTIDFSSCSLQHLLELNLANNKLKEPPRDYPPKLTIINLSFNQLEKTSHFNKAVREIDLSHNLLPVITKGTFRSASQLLSLDLSFNQLTIIYGHDFGGLHALRYLDLSHNAITHIRHEAFHPLRYILSVKIDNNNLHQLDTRLFANLPSQLQFQVGNNPWRCSCHLLASLSKATTSACKPHCKNLPELTCYERQTEVSAQRVLRQCIQAIQDSETVPSVQLLPDQQSSDEDTSEEMKKSSPFSYYMIIPTIALFVGIPLIALAIRTIYLNRKNMKRCCNCLANSPNARWTPHQNIDRESDSETEF